ncbi:MAG: [protein-PII] uridylyltransferase [Verrucomicrobia bacterium]|nr:MAG: [protein-PII] uridylyltransferase [Verrucomicrobiota bacterium]
MPTLLEKIVADASVRLPLPTGQQPSRELARYKGFLKVESHRLKMLHRAGAGGREICQARAAVLDVLLRYILNAVEASTRVEGKTPPPDFALVAMGGYGRGELNPQSDIDVMFLHNGDPISAARGKPHPYLSALTDGLLYTLWDIGLKVGHSVRTVDDCVKVANSDMQSKTSLIEARFITGDERMFKYMETVVLARCVRGFEDEYIAARLADQEARRAKFGNSATMQEPNIKNGCGGLRDFQSLIWMAFFKYRTRSLAELQKRELISESERKQLEAAYDFLLQVRNDLHYHVNRPADVLSKSIQPTIAHNLGYSDRSPVKRLEAFMGDLYSHMRNIYLITRTLEQRLALSPHPERRLPSFGDLLRQGRHRFQQQLVDGFKCIDGEIRPVSARVLRDQPRRLMRVFLYAQQRGQKLQAHLAQMIRNQLSLVDRAFLRDQHVRETFLEILNQRGNVAPILRAMHEVGLLGKYLPEFGRLTCLVQHEFYHQYTADEHTLVCLEQLDRIWEAEKAPHSNYSEIFRSVERPFVLYLALLLHDAGKARRIGKHSEIGGQLAVNVAKRLGLDAATTHSLRLVIEHHLTMTQISQRRDLDDPAVIRNFAAQIQNPEHLKLLTLHTFADTLGTSDKLWNGFKDSLLLLLFHKTMEQLTGGTAFIRAEEKQRALLADEVRQLMADTCSEEELQAHFATLPPRYYQIHSAKDILADLTLVHRFMRHQLVDEDKALEPAVDWHNEPDRGYTAVKVCTWDRHGLFSKIAGSLTATGLNILSAQIFTRNDGIILDTLFVTDARNGLLANKEEHERFEKYLSQALTGDIDLHALIGRRKVARPLYQSLEGERIPTLIRFDNETSDTRTVIDLETEDDLGLLYTISQALAELDLDIYVAKISTEKGAAIDSFYVSESGGAKIRDTDRQKEIERRLRTAIARLEGN